ncbi:MAG: S8 family serine peptidase [Rubrobacteraceae bacterium]
MLHITEIVEVFEEPGYPSNVGILKNPVNGKYRVPVPQNQAWLDKWLENSVKYLTKQSYTEKPDVREEDFELEWPSIWAKWLEGPKEDEELPEKFLAVVDTGYMTEHPLLQGTVEDTVDFTGEGIEDENGHGSICALLSLGVTSRIPLNFTPRLLIVKVAGRDGKGSPENLIKGFQWITQFKEERGLEKGDLVVSLSLGVYSKSWGTFSCQGNCGVCSAAIQAAGQGIPITAAAGNRPRMTACPAKAGVLGKHEMITAMGASDYANSGVGTLMTPTGSVFFAEVDI